MNSEFFDKDLEGSQELLNDLLNEVGSEESALSGGTRLGIGGKAIKSLLETRVRFGNPITNLTYLTEDLFKSIGVHLTDLIRQQMNTQFNFYYMTLPISMQPGRSAAFNRIECKLDFAPKGMDGPIIQTIFPKSEWKEILKLGRMMDLGLNGNLEWSAGVNSSDIPMIKGLSKKFKANIYNKNNLKLFITVPDYSFEFGISEIDATGEGNSWCFWRINSPDLKKTQTLHFEVVFKIPKGKNSIDLTGKVLAEPDMCWLTGNLRDIFDHLSEKLKKILRLRDEERRGKDRLPVGDHEKWNIALPNRATF